MGTIQLCIFYILFMYIVPSYTTTPNFFICLNLIGFLLLLN